MLILNPYKNSIRTLMLKQLFFATSQKVSKAVIYLY